MVTFKVLLAETCRIPVDDLQLGTDGDRIHTGPTLWVALAALNDVKPDADRDNAAYIDSLGWILFRRGQLAEARKALEKTMLEREEDLRRREEAASAAAQELYGVGTAMFCFANMFLL